MVSGENNESFLPSRDKHSRRSVIRAVGAGLSLTAITDSDDANSTKRTGSRQSAASDWGSSGPRSTSPPPGPSVLYDSLSSSRQLVNEPNSRWQADPLMVCGTDAYIDGEYLYQDYIFDDYGADTAPLSVPAEPHTDENSTGDFRYPTDASRYAYNAADLLDFRVMPTDEGVAYRVRLNTMTEADVAGVAIGIDRGGSGRSEWGYGIGSLGDLALDHVIVCWGTGAELDGEPIESTLSLEHNQVEVNLSVDPGESTWRHYVVVGLFDPEQGVFKQVQDQPTGTHPGGANSRDPPPVFNVGFRFNEPLEAGQFRFTDYREAAQATALSDRDIEAFHADINFSKLQPPTTTEYRIPQSGFLNRLYASRLDRGAGIDVESGTFSGSVQPYGVYIPEEYRGNPRPLHIDLHSGTNTHNDFAAHMPNRVRQFGENRGAIVLTPLARGTQGFYLGDREYAVFEACNDLAHHYNIDFSKVTIGGHSMGSYGTYKLAACYPDLFAAAFTTTGSTGDTFTDRSLILGSETKDVSRLTENLRHVPMLLWYGAADELAPLPAPLTYEQRLRDHGYQHELDIFTADHFTWPHLDEWTRAREFLDSNDRTTMEPARVTYRRIPAFDNTELGLIRDDAYWLTDIRVEDGERSGIVDAVSGAITDPDLTPINYESAGTEPLPYVARGTRCEISTERNPPQNHLEMTLDSIASLTVWVEEAQLDPQVPLELVVESTTRSDITLTGSFGTRDISVDAGRTVRTLHLVSHH